MKRDFLKALDLGNDVHMPDAAVEAIMAEHGKTTGTLQESINALTKERDGLQTQLTAAKAEAAKYADYDDVKNQRDALQKDIDTRNTRDRVAAATGVPASLLTGETEEACKAQAEALTKWKGTGESRNYPDTHNGGEPGSTGGGTTAEQFAAWFKEA